MYSNCKMHCWEIMHCSASESCPAKFFSDIPCWEIAEILGASKSLLNICQECIVYIINENDNVLTDDELDEIIDFRQTSGLSGNCPACLQYYLFRHKNKRDCYPLRYAATPSLPDVSTGRSDQQELVQVQYFSQLLDSILIIYE